MVACALLLSATLTAGQLPPPVPPQEVAPVIPAAPVQTKLITLDEFAATFQPLPGTYEIMFLHPIKKCPVNVTFTLPADCGCPKTRVRKHEIVFDYGGKHDVDIHFRLFGKVTVTTR